MLSYIGGKSRISKFINHHIPNDIEQFSEVFGGMMWVFFKLKLDEYPNLNEVIYNDFNKLNVNLINCVKNHNDFNPIIQTIKSQNEKLFYEFQEELFDDNLDFQTDIDNPNFELGYKYAYLLTQVWSGTNPTSSKFIDLKGKYKSKFDTFKDKVDSSKWHVYFDKIVKTENLDFEEFIEKYDSDKFYVYCDPPYYNTEKYYSNHMFNRTTHIRLANTLLNMNGKFSLSYYHFNDLDEWFPKDKYKWAQQDFAKAASAKQDVKQNKGTELLIMNY